MNQITGLKTTFLTDEEYIIYSIKDYSSANNEFIKKKQIKITDINDLCRTLEEDDNSTLIWHELYNNFKFLMKSSYVKFIRN
jgi:hypothetical protein